jgi:D-threo-aldose 1-dehydrogenase
MDPVETSILGRTGIEVTRLGLGTGPIGGLYRPVSAEDALATVRAAWEIGIRVFDTAPFYGYGMAERRLGTVLREMRRSDYTLSTKVGRLLRPPDSAGPSQPDTLFRFETAPPVVPVFDFSEAGAVTSLQESVARLGIDHVDILYIHDPYDYVEVAITGAYRELDRLRREGTVRAIGVGMGYPDLLLRLARAGDFDALLVAEGYSVLDQRAADALLPHCEHEGIGVTLGNVLHGGLLAGTQPEPSLQPSSDLERRAQGLRHICARWDVPPMAAALQFAVAHPAVSCVLVGARTSAEIEENVRLCRLPIPTGMWDDLRDAGIVRRDAPVP